jgi:hypothetical protein
MRALTHHIISALFGCVGASCLSSCANTKAAEERFQQAMRTVNEAHPQHTLAATDWRTWSMTVTRDRVVKVRGRIGYISRKTRDNTIGQDDKSFLAGVNCFLARDQDKLWPLQVGEIVTLKGLLDQGTEEDREGGASLFACVILRVEPAHSTTKP